MPLFDFDYEWDDDEYWRALPKQVPFVGPWIGRLGGEWWPYWDMSEEEVAASVTVAVAGGVAMGAGWGLLNTFELYRTLKTLRYIVQNPVTAVPIAAIYSAQRNLQEPPPTEYDHPQSPWYLSVAQGLTGGPGVGTWSPL